MAEIVEDEVEDVEGDVEIVEDIVEIVEPTAVLPHTSAQLGISRPFDEFPIDPTALSLEHLERRSLAGRDPLNAGAAGPGAYDVEPEASVGSEYAACATGFRWRTFGERCCR
jgi:hypothetical protein